MNHDDNQRSVRYNPVTMPDLPPDIRFATFDLANPAVRRDLAQRFSSLERLHDNPITIPSSINFNNADTPLELRVCLTVPIDINRSEPATERTLTLATMLHANMKAAHAHFFQKKTRPSGIPGLDQIIIPQLFFSARQIEVKTEGLPVIKEGDFRDLRSSLQRTGCTYLHDCLISYEITSGQLYRGSNGKAAYSALANVATHKHSLYKGRSFLLAHGRNFTIPSEEKDRVTNIQVKNARKGRRGHIPDVCVAYITNKKPANATASREEYIRSIRSRSVFPIDQYNAAFRLLAGTIAEVAPYYLEHYPQHKFLFERANNKAFRIEPVLGITQTYDNLTKCRIVRQPPIMEIIPTGIETSTSASKTATMKQLRKKYNAWKGKPISSMDLFPLKTMKSAIICDRRSIKNVPIGYMHENGHINMSAQDILKIIRLCAHRKFPHPKSSHQSYTMWEYLLGKTAAEPYDSILLNHDEKVSKMNDRYSHGNIFGYSSSLDPAVKSLLEKKVITVLAEHRSSLKILREKLTKVGVHPLVTKEIQKRITNVDGDIARQRKSDPNTRLRNLRYRAGTPLMALRAQNFNPPFILQAVGPITQEGISRPRRVIDPRIVLCLPPYARQMANSLDAPQLIPIIKLLCKIARVSYNAI